MEHVEQQVLFMVLMKVAKGNHQLFQEGCHQWFW